MHDLYCTTKVAWFCDVYWSCLFLKLYFLCEVEGILCTIVGAWASLHPHARPHVSAYARAHTHIHTRTLDTPLAAQADVISVNMEHKLKLHNLHAAAALQVSCSYCSGVALGSRC